MRRPAQTPVPPWGRSSGTPATGADFLYHGLRLGKIPRESRLAELFRVEFGFWPDEVPPGWRP